MTGISSRILIGGLLLSLSAFGSSPAFAAGPEMVDFDSEQWTLINAEVTEHLGRKALSGFAVLQDVDFEDGVIEVDIAVDGSISYPGLVFRMTSNESYERFYIRPHKMNGAFQDALQYTPVFNGIAGWQLYSGEGYTASVTLPADRWIPLKIEVAGSRARLYLDGAEEPALIMDNLEHGISSGAIGLFGPKNQTAYFSNFRYSTDEAIEFPPLVEQPPPYGVITNWEISQPFRNSEFDGEKTPAAQGIVPEWMPVTASPSGLVDVARHVKPIGGEANWICARTTIESEEGGDRKLWLGYSDIVTVFLNGRRLFTANSAYRSRSPGFAGIIGYNDCLDLPLKKGENGLLLLLGEVFGGWGFMARDGDAYFQHESLTRLWEVDNTFKYPESAEYDAERNVLYVSNFYRGGNEFISRVAMDGTILDLEWVAGLTRPTGLCVVGEKLFVVERQNLVKIDIGTAAVEERYPIPGAVFPNDVTRDEAGRLYITDNDRSVIYRYEEGRIEVLVESDEISRPNGIYHHRNHLVVGCTGDASLKTIDLEDMSIERLAGFGAGSIMDGVRPDGEGNFIVSDFRGRVWLVSPSGEKKPLINTWGIEMSCADLEYIGESGLLIIPTLYDNRLVAYQVKNPG